MGSSNFKDGNLLVDGKPFYLRGGEIHYFRLPEEVWKERLEQASRGGLNTVSSYMPWYWHEPEEGGVDLTGKTKPERNLKLFLDLSMEAGLKVIARPGPFINSELRLGGFPEWLFREHPETMSKNSTGETAPGRPAPAEGEPLYRKYVKRWYDSINPLLAEYDIHNGGNIILFQPDNELSAAWSFGLLNSLYDAEILESRWPAWLEKKYIEVVNYNLKTGGDFTSFSDVPAPRSFPSTKAERAAAFDWLEFKRYFFADWGATLAGWASEAGIKVPFLFNEPVAGYYGHGDHAGFGSLLKERNLRAVTACHTYSDRITDIEGSVRIALGAELVKSSPLNGPAFSVEAGCSWYIPRLSRSEINWQPLLKLGFAHGLKGLVVYPYAAGEAPPEDTIDGPEYWPDACVKQSGEASGSYFHVKRYYDFISAWEDEILSAECKKEIYLCCTPGMRALDFLGAPSVSGGGATAAPSPGKDKFTTEPGQGKPSDGHDWLDGYENVTKQTVPPEAGLWERFLEAMILLKRLNYSYGILDPVNPSFAPGENVLAVPCAGSLESEAIDYLAKHISSGGRCVFFPTVPFFDMHGAPNDRIPEMLGVSLKKLIRPAGGRLMDYGSRYIETENGGKTGAGGWIFIHKFPEDSRVLCRSGGDACTASLAGGRVILAGTDMRYTTNDSLSVWGRLISGAAGPPSVKVEGAYCRAVLREGKSCSFLTVVNLGGESGESKIHIGKLGAESISFGVELKPHEARILVMDAPVRDNRIIYSSSEVVPLNPERSELALCGEAGTKGEAAFASPARGRLNGSECSTVESSGLHVLRYEHGSESLILKY